MCEYFGYRVAALKRVRVLNFVVDGIPLGGYREATEAEMRSLRELLRDSSGKPYKER